MTSLADMNVLMSASPDSGKSGFMDALPDPMKLDWHQVLFVIVLLTLLHVFLKYVFFKPITRVMDDRDADIQAGTAKRAEAATLVERRQADYAERLKELRLKAFEHRKALAAAASAEKQQLLEQARGEANVQRTTALAELAVAREAARVSLLAQVDSLSESMVQHLLKQA
jgi:F-type H+-transporting ATPase subunit b